MARQRGGKAGQVALCAVLCALSVVLLLVASVVPSGKWAIAAAAGLAPAAAVVSAGVPAGVMTWAAGAMLGLVLAPDKGVALLYLLFLGAYPVVKHFIERLRRLALEIVCKLAFFCGAATAAFFALGALLPLPAWEPWVIYAAGSAVFLVYDYGFSKLIALYTARIAGRRN